MTCPAASATCASATKNSAGKQRIEKHLCFRGDSDCLAACRSMMKERMNSSHPEVSQKSYAIAVCLSAIFGVLGVQHFYLERWVQAAIDVLLLLAAVFCVFTGQFLLAAAFAVADAFTTRPFTT